MLRGKLLLIFLGVMALLLALAVLTLVLLQNVLDRQRGQMTLSRQLASQSEALDQSLKAIQLQLETPPRVITGPTVAHLAQTAATIQRQVAQFRQHYHNAAEGSIAPEFSQLDVEMGTVVDLLAKRSRAVPMVLSAQEVQVVRTHIQRIRMNILKIAMSAGVRFSSDQERLAEEFRNVVICLGLGFLVVLNGSFFLMLRAALMVLRPVEKLVVASRQWAQERFAYRVQVKQKDEFGELSEAFNQLAQQLEFNEARKLEMIRQVARTLNHELNNAMGIISLQLKLLETRSAQDDDAARHLKQIHHSLQRMAEVVQSLKEIRRIVLTEYLDGQKMLDLSGSLASQAPVVPSGSSMLSR